MKIENQTRFLIVGLGLLGGSYAQGLKKLGCPVRAVTRSQSSIDYALAHGLIDMGAAAPDPALLAWADVVVLAVYPHVLLEWLAANQNALRPGALITDVTGVKGCVVEKAQAMLRPDLEYIPAHPMAGRETLGVQNADCRIFQGANYIVTPTEKNTPEAIAACEALGRMLGFARISRLSPQEHDRMIGFVSQLTHCIAVALMTCNDIQHLEDYTGDSFRDLTRIAKINDEMWTELFLDNRPALLEQMDAFSAQFAKMRDLLDRRDAAGMGQIMRQSTARRKALEAPKP